MAKIDLKFLDCLDIYNLDNIKVTLEKPTHQINHIKITSTSYQEGKENKIEIYLDKSTAIRFAKTLRTEINKITESEVNNG